MTTLAIEDAPFVDAHVHYWNLKDPELEYEWLSRDAVHPMSGDIDGVKVTRFAIDEFVAQSRFQNVSKAIHVGVTTNEDPVLETRWLQSLADRSGPPQGIIAKADLSRPDARETLLRHLEHPNMRGVRDNGQPGSFRDTRWRDNYAFLGQNDLVFCHQVGLARMEEAIELVSAFPDNVFCLDHCAMPLELDADGFARWGEAVKSIAAAPNVVVKISAVGQWARGWTPESMRPWISACIEAFGTKRAFFGSNFPVDGLSSSFPDLINLFRSLIGAYSADEQKDLLARNAERIFRI